MNVIPKYSNATQRREDIGNAYDTITDDPSCPSSASLRTDAWAIHEHISELNVEKGTTERAYHFGLDSAVALSRASLHVAFSLPEVPQLDSF